MNEAHGITVSNLLANLPPVLAADESMAALAASIAQALAKRPEEIRTLSIYSRIDELPEELLDDLERHVAAQKLYAPRMPYDPGAEELFGQIDVFRPLIEDAAYIALIEVQHFAAQAEHEGGLQHLPDFRHDGFGKLKFPEVLPPDADDGTGKV